MAQSIQSFLDSYEPELVTADPVASFLDQYEPEGGAGKPEGSWFDVASTILGQTANTFMRQIGRAGQTMGTAPADFRGSVDELLASEPEAEPTADPWQPGISKEQRLKLIQDERLAEQEQGRERLTTGVALVTSAALSGGLYGALMRRLAPGTMRAADQKLAETGKVIGDEASAQVDDALQKLNLKEDSFKWYVTNGGQAFINMLPSLAVGMANPALGLSLMGSQAYADVYGDAVKKGLDPQDARAKAAFDTVAELIFENKVFDIALKPGAKLVKKALAAAGAEGLQESFTEIMQAGYEAGVLDDEMSLGDAWKRVRQAFVLGAGVGAGMGTFGNVANKILGREEAAEEPPAAPPEPTPAPLELVDIDHDQVLQKVVADIQAAPDIYTAIRAAGMDTGLISSRLTLVDKFQPTPFGLKVINPETGKVEFANRTDQEIFELERQDAVKRAKEEAFAIAERQAQARKEAEMARLAPESRYAAAMFDAETPRTASPTETPKTLLQIRFEEARRKKAAQAQVTPPESPQAVTATQPIPISQEPVSLPVAKQEPKEPEKSNLAKLVATRKITLKLSPEDLETAQVMAEQAGWSEIGGRILRERLDSDTDLTGPTGPVIGRTKWAPKAEWWSDFVRDKSARLTEKGLREAVRKASAGEPMSAQEKRAIQWLIDTNARNTVPDAFDESDYTDDEISLEPGPEHEAYDFMQSGREIGLEDDIIEQIVERGAIQGLENDAIATQLREAGARQAEERGRVAGAPEVPQRPEAGLRAEEEVTEGLTLTAPQAPVIRAQQSAPSTADLFGQDTTTEQAIADKEREVNARLGSGREAVPAESKGDLLDENRTKQADIADVSHDTERVTDITKAAEWRSLGWDVGAALPHNASRFKPQPRDFIEAAKSLNITPADAATAWRVFNDEQTAIPKRRSPRPLITRSAQEQAAALPVAESVQAPTAATESTYDNQIRSMRNLDRALTYDPEASVVHSGKKWSYMTTDGNEHPAYFETRKEALSAAQSHKELKLDQYNNPSSYFDAHALRAGEQVKLIKKYMDQGMTEMDAGKRALAEMPDLVPDKTPTAPDPITAAAEKLSASADKLAAAADKLAGGQAQGKIEDLGEKIGGARKDTSTPTGKRIAGSGAGKVPAWRKRYVTSQVMNSATGEGIGKWHIIDTRTGKPIRGSNYRPMEFSDQEAADAALPLAAVSEKHSAYKSQDGTYTIWRKVGDRRRVRVIPETFPSREDAMQFMAENAEKILETKLSFGEEVLPTPEKVMRTGEARRTGNVSGQDFMDVFGFRAVEFGLWENQEERQEVMNHAYDALLDMAEILDVPPLALSLNSELALAFGARGQGLSGAKAHYEREHAVINLTKMKGAGSLGHEWLHALDSYLARLDDPKNREKITNASGDLVYKTTGMASEGYVYNSEMREELRAAYKNLIQTMFMKAAVYVEDTQKAEDFLGKARDELARKIHALRDGPYYGLSKQLDTSYRKRNHQPATAEQLARFDELTEKLLSGESLEMEIRYDEKKKLRQRFASSRRTNDVLDEMSEIVKKVRGSSGFNAQKTGVIDQLSGYITNYRQRIQMLKDAESKIEKTKGVPTSYVMQAKAADQAKAGEYWSSNQEMAARAFAAYMEDKLAEKSATNDFLVYRAHGAVIVPVYPEGLFRPYPEGEERVAINKAFDEFFNVLETRETEVTVAGEQKKGVALFSLSDNTIVSASIKFARQVTDYLAGKLNQYDPLTLGDTPSVLLAVGAKKLPLQMDPSILKKAVLEKHGLPVNAVKQLVTQLHNPVMVFDSKQEGAFVVLTELTDGKGSPIIAAVHLDLRASGGLAKVNKIASVYGKENLDEVQRWMNTRLRYINNKKAPVLADRFGLQLPDESQSQEHGERIVTDADIVKEDINFSVESLVDSTTTFTKAQAEAVISKSSQILSDSLGLQINVIESADIPASVKAQVPAGKFPKGFNYQGQVYLVADAMENARDAQLTFAHEVIGHAGMEAIMGPVRWQALQTRFAGLKKVGGKQVQELLKEVQRRNPGAQEDAALELREFIAIAAEQREAQGPVARFLSHVIEMLRKALRAIGLQRPFSMSDINALLEQSTRYLRGQEANVDEILGTEEETGYQTATESAFSISPESKVFYSQLLKSIQEATQARATPQQWEALFKKSGVKQDELDWLDVKGFFSSKPIITKDELAEFVAMNQVEVQVVVKSEREALIKSGMDIFNMTRVEAEEFADEPGELTTGEVPGGPKFSQYQLPGGRNYTEVFLTAPSRSWSEAQADKNTALFEEYDPLIGAAVKRGDQAEVQRLSDERDEKAEAAAPRALDWEDGHSQYDDIINPVVRLRMNERIDANGKRVLFLEEVQSPSKDNIAKMPRFLQNLERRTLIGMKWALRYAAENGFDSVAWTTGSQQAERYDLSKHVDSVIVDKQSDGNYSIQAKPTGESEYESMASGLSGDKLVNHIGKELAEKAINHFAASDERIEFSGLDLKVGGEGLKTFYDTMLPNIVNKYVKKWGAKVGETNIQATREVAENKLRSLIGEGVSVHSVQITPAMRSSVMQGQPLFSLEDRDPPYVRRLKQQQAQLGAPQPKPTEQPMPTGANVQFTEAETEKRFRQARFGLADQRSMVQRVEDMITHTWHGFSRRHIDLPNEARFALANEALRQYEAAPQFAKEEAIRQLRNITKDMSRTEYDLFTRKVILDDLAYESELGHELPFGYTDASLAKDKANVDAAVARSPLIQKRIAYRKAVQDIMRDELVQADILSDEHAKNPAYFRHQVLTYAKARQAAQGAGNVKTPRPGYAKRRHGSLEDINANYLEAEFEFLHRAMIDLKVVHTIKKITKDYDISARLKQQAKDKGKITGEKEDWRDLLPDGYKIWQPDKGNLFYTGLTVPERMINQLTETLSERDMFDGTVGVPEVQEVIEAMRKAVMLGGKKYEMAIPQEIAATLDKMRPDIDNSLFDHILATPLKWWKQWVLINPRRVLKYNLNNLSGDLDAVIAGNPRILKRVPSAIKELYAVMRGGNPSTRYQEAVERGVFDAGLTVQEIPDIQLLDPFQHLIEKPTVEQPVKFTLSKMHSVWKVLRDYTRFRENWLRYAAYLDYVERLESGESMASIGYGATNPIMADEIIADDIKDGAALLARDLVGDYGDVSAFGQGIRKKVIPFYSWMEVNTRRYLRLIANAYSQGIGKGLATSGVVGASIGVRTTAWLGIRMVLLYALVQLWNHLFHDDDEEKLSAVDRARLHINLGKDQDGNIRTVRFQGALSDFLQWFGAEDAVAAFSEMDKGRAGWGDVVEAVVKGPINKVVSGITPVIKTPVELLTGLSFYPDAFSPRAIRDKKRELAKMVSLENEYDWLAGKPSRGYGQSWFGSMVYKSDAGEMAYNKIRSMAYEYNQRTMGTEGYSTFTSPRSSALYDWRMAKRYKDKEAEQRALEKMKELGMTLLDRRDSINRAHPLGSIAKIRRRKFKDTLSPREKKTLEQAEQWYQETYKTP